MLQFISKMSVNTQIETKIKINEVFIDQFSTQLIFFKLVYIVSHTTACLVHLTSAKRICFNNFIYIS